MSNFEQDVRDFVALVMAGRSLEAMHRYYAENVRLRENYAEPRVGKEYNMDWERKNLTSVSEPPRAIARSVSFNANDGISMIELDITFVPRGGHPTRVEEVAVQRWCDGKIVSERFFYQGFIPAV